MRTCEDCWWYWTGVGGYICHHEMTNQEDMDSDGRNCPWFTDKDRPNEMEELEDIWN